MNKSNFMLSIEVTIKVNFFQRHNFSFVDVFVTKVHCEEDWQANIGNGYAVPVDGITCESGVVLTTDNDDAKNERQDWAMCQGRRDDAQLQAGQAVEEGEVCVEEP